MDNSQKVEALIRELDAQREAYLHTFQQVHEILAQNLAATVSKDTLRTETPPATTGAPRSPPPDLNVPQRPHSESVSRAASDRELPRPRNQSTGLSWVTSHKSRSTGHDDSDIEDDEALYVQEPLQPQSHEMEDLRQHLRSYKWNHFGKKIMDGVVGNPARLSQSPLIPTGKGRMEDRSDYTHYQVFDVGPDGSPLGVDFSNIEKQFGRPMALWHAIKEINPASKQRHAVGRITTLREPSPILFGAIHYTMHKTFDMDEIFRNLVEADVSSAHMRRAFEKDERRQRSFTFNLEYFTIIGVDCEPAKWQMAAGQEDRKAGHIQISRCSSVVALHLNGAKIRDVKNPSRHARNEKGPVFDPFSPWQVLNVQYYPDFKARMDIHDSAKHYVNGPEAFMTTLLGEFRDAKRRFEDITDRISKRVRPPLEFMFSTDIRDKLLFEDDDFSMARRYFWAHQTLGIMNESIKAMIDAYEDEFNDDVWEGRHKLVWPLLDETSARNKYYKKKMASLRKDFDGVIKSLQDLMVENNGRRREINGLREDLFTGTSIQESRRSVKATETTVQQGHNIKLLTLVSIFFLPLTFVTSVFGMTNMPTEEHYTTFAIVTITVCVPFFIMIGSLNTNRGMHFWRSRSRAAFTRLGVFFAWLARGRGKQELPDLDLAKAKSFESGSSLPGIHTRTSTFTLGSGRTSTQQRRFERARPRGYSETEEPTGREDERKRGVEDGPPPAETAGTARPAGTEPTASRLAEMWMDERSKRQRLRYREDV